MPGVGKIRPVKNIQFDPQLYSLIVNNIDIYHSVSGTQEVL